MNNAVISWGMTILQGCDAIQPTTLAVWLLSLLENFTVLKVLMYIIMKRAVLPMVQLTYSMFTGFSILTKLITSLF